MVESPTEVAYQEAVKIGGNGRACQELQEDSCNDSSSAILRF